MNPEFSIIVPVYNAEKYIKTCLDSLINQTCKDIEIICINDGSTDNTKEILEQLASKDNRIVVRTVKNAGQGAARNLGMSIAKGNYIMFVDIDDTIEPDACEVLLNTFSESNVDMIAFDYNIIINGYKIRKFKFEKIKNKYLNKEIKIDKTYRELARWSREPWFKVYKREFLEKNDIRMYETKMWEDFYFWNKIVSSNPTFIILDKPLYNYVQVEGSSSRTASKYFKQIFEVFKESNKYLLDSALNEDIKYAFLKFNVRWLDGWCDLFEEPYRKEAKKRKKKCYQHYAYEFKHNKKLGCLFPLFAYCYVNNMEKIFSIRNKGKRKIIRILGLKIKFKRKIKHKETSKINIKEIKIDKESIPAIEKIKDNAITLCFSANDGFFEYLAICLNTMKKHINPKKFYDIVILEKDLTGTNKALLQELETKNFSIRYYNLCEVLKDCNVNFTIHYHFAIENYFRLFIPYIFRNYEKVLYMDCDGIYQDDVAKIFNTDIGDYCIGATKDYGVINQVYNLYNTDYYFKVLKMKNVLNYINTGVMLMNINKLLECDFVNKTLNAANSFEPLYVDQCVINKVMEDKITLIDPSYNATSVLETLWQQTVYNNKLPDEVFKEYKDAINNPVFIHFMTHLKPWKAPYIKDAHLFWDAAKEYGFYERILYKNLERKM